MTIKKIRHWEVTMRDDFLFINRYLVQSGDPRLFDFREALQAIRKFMVKMGEDISWLEKLDYSNASNLQRAILLGYLKHSPFVPDDHPVVVELANITHKVTPELNVGYDTHIFYPEFKELGIIL